MVFLGVKLSDLLPDMTPDESFIPLTKNDRKHIRRRLDQSAEGRIVCPYFRYVVLHEMQLMLQVGVKAEMQILEEREDGLTIGVDISIYDYICPGMLQLWKQFKDTGRKALKDGKGFEYATEANLRHIETAQRLFREHYAQLAIKEAENMRRSELEGNLPTVREDKEQEEE